MSYNREILTGILQAYAANPIKAKKFVKDKLLEYEIHNMNYPASVMKAALRLIEDTDEKRMRIGETAWLKIGIANMDVKKLIMLQDMLSNGELSEDEFARLAVNLTTEDMLLNYEKTVMIEGYKYDRKTLFKIGTGLKDAGYIKDEKIFIPALSGHAASKPIWGKAKSHLVYLIEQIREDGKCPYAEIERNFKVPLKPNNNKGGFKIIDDIIKAATQQIGDIA